MSWLKNSGPGALIVAAFIGPGTVTVCSIAGASFGMTLLWALVLSVFATIILQEKSARIGIVTQEGLASVIRSSFQNPWIKWSVIFIILSAIAVGNTAYEAGNISGAVLGLSSLTELDVSTYTPALIGILGAIILGIGNYKVIEKSLMVLVILMSVSFIIAAILTKPNLADVFGGLIPVIPENGILMIIGIIGTTVVPYNLFLHASLAKEKWKDAEGVQHAKRDLIVSIVLGGLISICIMICAAGVGNYEVKNAGDLAKGLEPLYGSWAKYLLGLGLCAAGITSAITAPLAAAYVVQGCFGWDKSLKHWKFRAVWLTIILFGITFSSLNFKPVEVITFAQIANGLTLPVIAILLLWIVNSKKIMGQYTNSLTQNILSILIILLTLILGIKGIITAF